MVPGGGPSLDDQRWVTSRHPTQRRRKPYLTDNKSLGCEFRKQYVRGLRRLIRSGQLRIDAEWAFLADPAKREAWLDELETTAWNVFIEGPPHGRSQPEHVIKYLARYISGGPIADRRLISDQDDQVTFWARTKDKANKSKPFTLRGHEFVRRWSMHILPKGFTRSRSYGGYHGTKLQKYLTGCRELLGAAQAPADSDMSSSSEIPESTLPKCERCKLLMTCTSGANRPSWRKIFGVSGHDEPIDSALWHLAIGKRPSAHSIEGYG